MITTLKHTIPLMNERSYQGIVSKGVARFGVRLQLLVVTISILASAAVAGSGPVSFDAAKHALVDVYRENPTTLYCGCTVTFNRDAGGHPRNTGGVIDHASCGYEIHSNELRGNRLEWEHILPISMYTASLSFCATRSECREHAIYRAIEGNAHNLTLSVGEINAVRSNYRLVDDLGDDVTHDAGDFGGCEFRVDRDRRLAEPAPHTRGFIARTKLYIADRYGLELPMDMQERLVRWHEDNPPDAWELERNLAVAQIQGHPNPFTTGERTWFPGKAPAGEGLVELRIRHAWPGDGSEDFDDQLSLPIRGNTNSKIYHRSDCPSYDRIAPHNIREFDTADEAERAGFREAGNCP